MTTTTIPVCPCGRPVRTATSRGAKGMCRRCYVRDYRILTGRRAEPDPERRNPWRRTITPKTVHERCRALWGPARNHQCIACGSAAQEWAYDGADETAIYSRYDGRWVLFSRFPEFYMPMCQSCHRRRDFAEITAIVHAHRLARHGGGCDG